jgi:hypothetical protein
VREFDAHGLVYSAIEWALGPVLVLVLFLALSYRRNKPLASSPRPIN